MPRWEWRAFGAPFGGAEEMFRPTGAPEQTDERYVLAGIDVTVKLRAGAVDVKVLRETNADGLERWEPVLRQGFPLTAADVERVLVFLGAPAQTLTRESYDEQQLFDEVLENTDGMRTVDVHKRRTHATVAGCSAEITDVVAGGRATMTIAVESEDAAALIAAVRGLHLDGYRNTSYPRGLAALLDDAPVRDAVIDVGTNSVKLVVGERTLDGGWRTVVDRGEVTRLGEGADDEGTIAPKALERTARVVAAMADEARAADVRAIAAVGTAALRAANNADDVIAAIRARSGVSVEVISGEDESRLAYVAAMAALGHPGGSSVVFDTGGGSSQFTFGRQGAVEERFSVPIGAARLTERFGLDRAVSADVVADAQRAIADELGRLDGRPTPDALIGLGGAITTMTAVMLQLATYDGERVRGATLTEAEVDRQIDRYRALPAVERPAIVGLQPKRAEVILAGACIVRTVLRMLGCTSLTVSDRGLRHGLLDERFS